MSSLESVYFAGWVASTLTVATYLERERRTSPIERERDAVLRPGLEGVVIGLVWPLIIGGCLLLGLFGLVAADTATVYAFRRLR